MKYLQTQEKKDPLYSSGLVYNKENPDKVSRIINYACDLNYNNNFPNNSKNKIINRIMAIIYSKKLLTNIPPLNNNSQI